MFEDQAPVRRDDGADGLARPTRRIPELAVHPVGHSAGSILLGHVLDRLGQGVRIASATLFAPACTAAFAIRHYQPAVEHGRLRKKDVFIEGLDDEREKADPLGPYGTSRRYLVTTPAGCAVRAASRSGFRSTGGWMMTALSVTRGLESSLCRVYPRVASGGERTSRCSRRPLRHGARWLERRTDRRDPTAALAAERRRVTRTA